MIKEHWKNIQSNLDLSATVNYGDIDIHNFYIVYIDLSTSDQELVDDMRSNVYTMHNEIRFFLNRQ